MKFWKTFLKATAIHTGIVVLSAFIAFMSKAEEPLAIGVSSSVLILWCVYLRGDKSLT